MPKASTKGTVKGKGLDYRAAYDLSQVGLG
jgi:hypothetical protein